MTYQKLLNEIEPNTPTSIYLALLPQHYPLAIKGLVDHKLLSAESQIIIEKPLSLNAFEGERLLNLLREFGLEEQTQLVEHFNQKEALANTIYFRGNTPFEKSLNRKDVQEIRIYALEKIIVPSERVQFFDTVRSQLRDMITHLLSAMSYPLLIELPENLDVYNLRREKEKIALNMRVVDAEKAIWGQYEGYPTPTTSTFNAFTLDCQNLRWQGVKIQVVTGKGLPEKYCGMEVIFHNGSRLVFRHYPNEGITFYFPVKKPGAGVELVPAKMEFTYENTFQQVNQPAYLRLLSDILAGDKSSFASPIEALQALRIADELEAHCVGSLVKYPVGTYPEEAKDWLPSEWG
jgi:glucose-6-phosphate 1-dehydrogenase